MHAVLGACRVQVEGLVTASPLDPAALRAHVAAATVELGLLEAGAEVLEGAVRGHLASLAAVLASRGSGHEAERAFFAGWVGQTYRALKPDEPFLSKPDADALIAKYRPHSHV